jgi:hypothetical protein
MILMGTYCREALEMRTQAKMIHRGNQAAMRKLLSFWKDNSSHYVTGFGHSSIDCCIVTVPRHQTTKKLKSTTGTGQTIQKIRMFH